MEAEQQRKQQLNDLKQENASYKNKKEELREKWMIIARYNAFEKAHAALCSEEAREREV